LAALLCWAVAAWRYLADSTPSAIRHVADTVFFALMFVEVVSGLLTAILYRWASSWAVSTLTPYARSLFYGKPSAALVSGMPFVVQVHIVTTFLLLAVFPFTRIAALLIRGFDHGQVLLFRMAVAQVRAAGAVLTRRYNPSAWVWPEEEE
jgi:nitrate reductase gamma subunit